MFSCWTVENNDGVLADLFFKFDDAVEYAIQADYDERDSFGSSRRLFYEDCKRNGKPFEKEWNFQNFQDYIIANNDFSQPRNMTIDGWYIIKRVIK